MVITRWQPYPERFDRSAPVSGAARFKRLRESTTSANRYRTTKFTSEWTGRHRQWRLESFWTLLRPRRAHSELHGSGLYLAG